MLRSFHQLCQKHKGISNKVFQRLLETSEKRKTPQFLPKATITLRAKFNKLSEENKITG